MNVDTTVDDLDGFTSLTEMIDAINQRNADLHINPMRLQGFCYSLIAHTKSASWIIVFEWAWLWVTFASIAASVSSLGWSSLVLLAVGLISIATVRPWTTMALPTVVLGATAVGLFLETPIIVWSGINWFAIWYLSYLWYSWCKRKVLAATLRDESLFAEAYRAGVFKVVLSTSNLTLPD